MFLEEKIYNIAKEVDLNSNESITEGSRKIVTACLENLSMSIGNVNKNPTISVMRANFKRVNFTWKMLVRRLQLENRCFLKEDGFEKIIKIKFEELSYLFDSESNG